MTTPSREEAPERLTLVMGETDVKIWWADGPKNNVLYGPQIEYLRADLANREPSEGEVERGARAIYATGQDLSDPDWSVTSEPRRERFRQAFLAAINAWRNQP